jgi:exodeoxyribonuclease-5
MNNLTLNEGQKAAIDSMIDFVAKKEKDFFCLIGSAGTGKTTTIQQLLDKLPEKKICFTAPTNKAVRVLKKMAVEKGLNVQCLTIFSLLGLSVTVMGDKEVIKSGGKSSLDKFDIVVIDEMSMINSELLTYIHRAVNMATGGTQVIMMGDAAQLPPVGEILSPTFAISNKAHLTKVMRQKSENPILGLCTDIRHAIEDGATVPPAIEPATNEAGTIGVHVMSGAMFQEWMPSAFSNENFDQNYDRFRVVAWRNKTIDFYNAQIQAIRYPNLELPFAIGEPVVFSSPLHRISTYLTHTAATRLPNDWDEILLSTESEGIIENIERLERFIFAPTPEQEPFTPFEIERYAITCKMLGSDEPAITCTITDKAQLAKLLSFVSARIKESANSFTWFTFWMLKKYFSDVRPAYAMTCHKSQGSTFENVFVDAKDILTNPNKDEALRCLYVAVSRASHNIVVNV